MKPSTAPAGSEYKREWKVQHTGEPDRDGVHRMVIEFTSSLDGYLTRERGELLFRSQRDDDRTKVAVERFRLDGVTTELPEGITALTCVGGVRDAAAELIDEIHRFLLNTDRVSNHDD